MYFFLLQGSGHFSFCGHSWIYDPVCSCVSSSCTVLLLLLLLQGSGHFSFCGHSWIYDPASKSRILQLENQMQQLAAFENSMMQVGEQAKSLNHSRKK
jgi:predicted amidohydrolase